MTKDQEMSADIIYSSDGANNNLISKDYLIKISELELYLRENITIRDARGRIFSNWKQVCLKDLSSCTDTAFLSPIGLFREAGIDFINLSNEEI